MPSPSPSERLRELPLDPGFRGLVGLGALLTAATLAWDALGGARYPAASPSFHLAFHPVYLAIIPWLVVGFSTALARRPAATHTLSGLLLLAYWLLGFVELVVGFVEWSSMRDPLVFVLSVGASSAIFLAAAYGLWHGQAWGRVGALIASLLTVVVFVAGAAPLARSGLPVAGIGSLNPYWFPLWLATAYLLARTPLVDR